MSTSEKKIFVEVSMTFRTGSSVTKTLSVVIPTIGRPVLLECLGSMGDWSLRPLEVIVIIPLDTDFDLGLYDGDLPVRLVSSPRGQVEQRLRGLQLASGDFVMQLDDDVFLGKHDAECLMKRLSLVRSLAVGPVWFKLPQKTSFFEAPSNPLTRFKEFALALLLGSSLSFRDRMGKISKAGVAYGVDPSLLSSAVVEVDWLSGGCILHRREDVILYNYFPYEGRASHEDLFHSWLLRARGIRLEVLKEARASTRLIIETGTFVDLLRDLRINRDFVRFAELSSIRYCFWYLYCLGIYCARYLIKYRKRVTHKVQNAGLR